MNYTFNQLQIFLKVVKTQSVTKASQELHLTQPAVSIQLKNFQNQFDIPLTEVVGRKIYITQFGMEIAEAAEKIIDQMHNIDYKTAAYKGQLSGRLKLSIVSTGKYIMPYFLADFVKDHQSIELEMDVTNKIKVVESLENNEVDFAFVSILPENINVDYVELMQNKLFLVGSVNDSYNKSSYGKEIFSQLPLIFREKGSGTRRMMETFIETNNIAIKKRMELTSTEAVKQSIKAGLGYSIMPLIGMKNELQYGQLRIIPVSGLPLITHWSIVWMKGKNHSPVAAAFLKYVEDNKAKIIKDQFGWYENY